MGAQAGQVTQLFRAFPCMRKSENGHKKWSEAQECWREQRNAGEAVLLPARRNLFLLHALWPVLQLRRLSHSAPTSGRSSRKQSRGR